MLQETNLIFDDIKKDFPIFKNSELVYLDSAASAQKPLCVIDKIHDLYSNNYSNVNRGVYKLSQILTDKYENSREIVKNFLNANLSSEIIFVRGATEAINLVANTVGKLNIRKNDEIILSRLEHHSNIVPWQILADMNSAVIKVAEPDIYGNITLESITKLISSNTKLISLTHVSNAIGTILPIKEICKEAKSRGIITLIDGCQAAPHMKIDVKELNCDFYVFSGHKTYGPTGIGVLYGRKELLEDAPPYQGGGDMIDKVTFEKTTYAPLPHKFEAGTPNIIGAIVLGEAITWMHKIGIENINNHLKKVTDRGLKILKNIKGIQIIGEIENRAGVISFLYKDTHPHDIATMLDTYDIALRTGHHCAQPTMQFFNVSSTLRASVGIYNSEQDFIKLEECIDKIKNMF